MLTTKFTLKLCSLPSNNKYASIIRYVVPKNSIPMLLQIVMITREQIPDLV